MVKDTRTIKTAVEAEKYFAITLTPSQADMIDAYLKTGKRPEGFGCLGCEEWDMRLLTGNIDIANAVYGE
jgi:hypothetical protein